MTSILNPSISSQVATDAHPRQLSPDAVRSGSPVRMLVAQARAELIKLLRAPDFVAPVVVLPVVLFVLFGSQAIGATLPDGTSFGAVIAASFTTYGVLGVVLFTFGEALAAERGQGWLRLVRATPLPGGVFVAAKFVAGLAIVALMVALMIAVTSVVGVGIGVDGWARIVAVSLLGAAAIAPIGFVLGLLVRPSAAGAVSLLLYLPLSYASGMWGPVDRLPEIVQAISPWLPTSHLASLAHAAVGLEAGSPVVHTAWLVGTCVVFGILALVAYRRVSGRQFA
jgi:ABC-2 type transport system permease protein